MMTLAHVASSPGVILAAAAVAAVAGPAGLVAALWERGWRPLGALRSRLSRRRR